MTSESFMEGIMRCCHSKLPAPDQRWCWLLTKARNSRDRKSLSSRREKGDSPARALSIVQRGSPEAGLALSVVLWTPQPPLHVPRVLGFPRVLRLGPAASLQDCVRRDVVLTAGLTTVLWEGTQMKHVKVVVQRVTTVR